MPFLTRGTYRVERRVVHTPVGVKTVITIDVLICRQCQVVNHPDLPCIIAGHHQRWRYVSGLATKESETDLLAILSADVAHFLRSDDTGNVL